MSPGSRPSFKNEKMFQCVSNNPAASRIIPRQISVFPSGAIVHHLGLKATRGVAEDAETADFGKYQIVEIIVHAFSL
jgi:hypothetical protein